MLCTSTVTHSELHTTRVHSGSAQKLRTVIHSCHCEVHRTHLEMRCPINVHIITIIRFLTLVMHHTKVATSLTSAITCSEQSSLCVRAHVNHTAVSSWAATTLHGVMHEMAVVVERHSCMTRQDKYCHQRCSNSNGRVADRLRRNWPRT